MTGSAGGIGGAAAVRFGQEGAAVVLVDLPGAGLEEMHRAPPAPGLLGELGGHGLSSARVSAGEAAGADSPVEAKIEAAAQFADEAIRRS